MTLYRKPNEVTDGTQDEKRELGAGLGKIEGENEDSVMLKADTHI
jgi:hypothetical protein